MIYTVGLIPNRIVRVRGLALATDDRSIIILNHNHDQALKTLFFSPRELNPPISRLILLVDTQSKSSTSGDI